MVSARNIFENKKKSNQAIREQVGHQKTKDQVGGGKQEIRERVIREKDQSGSENYGESYWGAMD